MRFLLRFAALLLLLISGLAASGAAQCPDGTPPPCGGAVAPIRRPAPALDERTWIVLPFDNVARAQDIDWLKDASVNLLYLDMSKWLDVRVIDDERVADLIREVPEARGVQLTLQSGIAVARRAGAGRLVMGDLLKVGSRTQLVGKVFDVRTGQRVRTVRQEAASADSIMAAFGQLARGVLDVASPPGASPTGIGTQSIGAYRAYMLGVGFLNRWILDSARVQFTRAIQLDSTFALAHYKLSIVYGWESSGNPAGRQHADAALRLGTGLPPRERALVTGNAAFKNGQNGDACEIFGKLVRADSTDVEAWYNLGECSYHDQIVVPVPGDSTRFVFRGDWNTMLRAFRRTLELDPTYHLAFQHIQDALLVSTRGGCRYVPGADLCAEENTSFQSYLRRSGDSLLLIPVNVRNTAALIQQAVAARQEGARTQNLLEARRVAEAWLAAGPNELRPRIAYGKILLRLGEVALADSTFRRLPTNARLTAPEAAGLTVDRIDAALKLGRVAEARRQADSLSRAMEEVGGGARAGGALVSAIFGRTSGLAAMVASQAPGTTPPWVKGYFVQQMLAVLGGPSDSLWSAEATFAGNLAARMGPAAAANQVATSLLFVDPRIRGSRWPVSDTASKDPRLAAISWLAVGDTARFRARLAQLDSTTAQNRDAPDDGIAMVSALLHLAVRDSAVALAKLRGFVTGSFLRTGMLDPLGGGFARTGMLWPRTFLLLGDLEAAAGDPGRAKSAYQFFVEVWSNADPEYQPLVERARAALQRRGS
jgi:eukaryotic-like serine/threonine-protein kinase